MQQKDSPYRSLSFIGDGSKVVLEPRQCDKFNLFRGIIHVWTLNLLLFIHDAVCWLYIAYSHHQKVKYLSQHCTKHGRCFKSFSLAHIHNIFSPHHTSHTSLTCQLIIVSGWLYLIVLSSVILWKLLCGGST